MNGGTASAACASFELSPGAVALPHGLLLLERTGTLIAADVHFGYEDVIGGALPLWSTAETASALARAVARHGARELVLLGDVVHGTRMSEGAARAVGAALDGLRAICEVVPIAGNHEGRSRGRALLGETCERLERDGWLLIHGDRAPDAGARCIVGHLHPSLRLGAGASIPAFLSGDALIVAPALTPYSPGLDVRSDACARAVRALGSRAESLAVVACGDDRVYPFGTVGSIRAATRRVR